MNIATPMRLLIRLIATSSYQPQLPRRFKKCDYVNNNAAAEVASVVVRTPALVLRPLALCLTEHRWP